MVISPFLVNNKTRGCHSFLVIAFLRKNRKGKYSNGKD
mgnify:CR=1 FL=1